MRVAVIAGPGGPVPPDGYGPVESFADALCRGLDAAGHDVLLCAAAESTCAVERAGMRSAADWDASAGEMNEFAYTSRYLKDAYAAAESWGADVIHDNGTLGPLTRRKNGRAAVAMTLHTPMRVDHNVPFYRQLQPSVGIVAISRDQASRARAAGVPVSAVVHHGIALDEVPVGRGDGGYALFLGRISRVKGLDVAIDVARRAGIRLVIAAKLCERRYFAECVRPVLGPDVEYVGEVGRAEKYDLIGNAACLLNPIAWDEPFGLVMIEALAAGTPVIATGRGSVPEIVDDGVTGWIRDDVRGLVGGVGRVGEIDRASCRRAAEERFSLHTMAARYATVYRSILASAGATRRNALTAG